MLKLLRTAVCSLAVLAGVFGTAALPAYAAVTATDGVAHSYGTDDTIRQGMIVGLKPGSTTKVTPLSRDRLTDMLGVVVSASDAPITISGETSSAQVYVVASGRYNVLVSNQNGPIHAGDYVSISALNGVGMKAQDTEPLVLGKAAADFNGTASRETGTATLKNNGGTTTVVVGVLAVDIAIAGNPNHGRGTGDLPGFLQVASGSVADKPVSAPRVYLSLVVLGLTVVIAGSLLYSGVRNSIVSIGRNPLAKRSIMRGLVQVVLTSIIIFILGLFAVYLLLRL